jgi:hypothetical protein
MFCASDDSGDIKSGDRHPFIASGTVTDTLFLTPKFECSLALESTPKVSSCGKCVVHYSGDLFYP